MNTNNKHPHFSRTVLHNGEERVKRIFRDQLAELAGLLEVGISLLVVVALMLAVVPLIKMLPGLLVDTNEVEISLFLQRALDIVIGIEFIGRQDAVCIAGFEERDRDHQGAGELESLILGKDEVVRHPEGLHRERANSRSMAPLKNRARNAITAKAKLQRRHAGVVAELRRLVGGAACQSNCKRRRKNRIG